MSDDQAPSSVLGMAAKELAVLLQLHMWLAIGLEEICRAFEENDGDRAMVLARLLQGNECVQRDSAIVEAITTRAFPLLFHRLAAGRREQLRARLDEQATTILAEVARDDEAANTLGRRAKDLPS